MDLRVLEYFLAVAEVGGISRAADILHISQPTLSRQLMELEREIGSTLLIRGKRSVTLTPDGLMFRETTRDILALYQKAQEKHAQSTELSGDIYLGSGETESFSTLADQIKAFQERYPKVCFHIFSAHAEKIRDDVDKGLLDLGLMMRSVSTEKYENLAIGREEHWGVLLPREHPLAERDALDPKELRKTPLILPENTVFRKEVLCWIGGQSDVRATYTLVRNAILLELAGGGHIVCLDMPATSSHGLVFVPFAPTRKSEPVLIWKQNSAVSPAVQVFLDYLDHPEEE